MKPNPSHLATLPPALAALALSLFAFPAGAADLRLDAAGVEVDLLPTVSSAAAGEAGGALQAWVGASGHRLRLVGAHLHYPDAFVSKPFADRSATVVAVLYDRFLRDDYTGPWVAAGAEYWWSRIGLASAEGRGSWGTPVATLGAGWVFPIWRGLYLNPWAAGHAPLDTGRVTVGMEQYRPRAFEAEVSLKVGWCARSQGR
ncbi:MAG: hypothetical protein NDI82_05975 [Anaeromyxobacteraceae bacterium]|nr:hypothetical protein [Anaeromyxobacteraceae bacterium]